MCVMKDENRFDLAVIGGGPGGYLAAERAAAAGLRTVLFEKRSLGGTCLNEGCIPTKSFLYSAKLYSGALHGEGFGVHADALGINHPEVLARKNKVVAALVSGVAMKMQSGKIQVIAATATLKNRLEDGFAIEADEIKYYAKNVIIASGSEAIIPQIPGVKEGINSGRVVTSREMLDIKSIPEKLTIIGGGVIGLEMADYFNTAGAEVTVIEMLDKIAGPFDAEISGILQKELSRRGIRFMLGKRVTQITVENVVFESGDGEETTPADIVLLSIGRRPVTEGLGLETLGIEMDRGAIITDDHMRTNVMGIYAVGDVNSKLMLAHTAYREAEVAVENILGKNDVMSYEAVPSVLYTYPEAASVGETEQTAKEKGVRFEVKKLPMAYSGRYLAETENGRGICKLLINEKEQVIGAQLIGNYASEIILSACVMIESGLSLETFKKVVFPHPTVGEIIRETMFV